MRINLNFHLHSLHQHEKHQQIKKSFPFFIHYPIRCFASLFRTKYLLISATIAGIKASGTTTSHCRSVNGTVLNGPLRNGTKITSSVSNTDRPTARCIHLLPKKPNLISGYRYDRAVYAIGSSASASVAKAMVSARSLPCSFKPIRNAASTTAVTTTVITAIRMIMIRLMIGSFDGRGC